MKKQFKHGVLTGVAGLLLSASIAQADDDHHHSSTSFKASDVTGDIKMLQGKGGNIAVLKGQQGLFMVDSDYHDMSSALRKALKPLGGSDQLTYIVNTHWHGDHSGGNLDINLPATIVAHDNVRERLLSRQEIKLFNMVSEPYPEEALPSLTYRQALTLYINNEEVELLHLPNGHTDGDTVVFFNKANVVHMGDHFFNGFYPFVDVGSGGNVLNMAKNIEKVLARIDDETKVIPGHGPLSNKAELKAFKDMLQGTAKEVQIMKDKGMNLKKIQQRGLSTQWDVWTKGFINEETWISIVYSSL